MNRRVVASLLAVGCLGGAAQAAVLWDQSSLDWAGNAFLNAIAGSPPFGVTSYAVADVTVPAGGWNVDSVTMYWSCLDFNWPSTTTGRLYLQPKTGSLPSVLPGGSLIPMTIEILNDPSVSQSYYAVTASGLNRNLAAGDYWIGITPSVPSGFFGPELSLPSAPTIGAPSAYLDASNPVWTGLTNDAAILVQSVPAPASVGVFGLAGLLAARRRRA